jgi:DNA-binding XRE family transcriptional regulator/mannose-6-phosphate isomerase-like protein (cupin superfamily)
MEYHYVSYDDGALQQAQTDPSEQPSVATVLRAARVASGRTQRQIATEAGVSAGLIGQIETGRTQPSVATLLAIARVLDLSLDDLFAEETDDAGRAADSPADATPSPVSSAPGASHGRRLPGPPNASFEAIVGRVRNRASASTSIEDRIARAGHREVITLEGGVTWELLTPEIDHELTFMLVTYPAGSSSSSSPQLLRHDDFEYFYILSGQLHVKVGFEETVLEAGDSMSFDSSRPHRFMNRSETATATGLWAVRSKTTD